MRRRCGSRSRTCRRGCPAAIVASVVSSLTFAACRWPEMRSGPFVGAATSTRPSSVPPCRRASAQLFDRRLCAQAIGTRVRSMRVRSGVAVPRWTAIVARPCRNVPDRPASSKAMPSRKVCLPARSSPSQPQPWASMRRSGQVHVRLRASIPRSGDCRRAVCRRSWPSGAFGRPVELHVDAFERGDRQRDLRDVGIERARVRVAREGQEEDEEERARHWGGRIAGSRELYPRARIARSIPLEGG